MAGFVEVMRNAKRMCSNMECGVCPLFDAFNERCFLTNEPLCQADSDLTRNEAAIVKWAAENPETRYPTWREWQQENFPEANGTMCPCAFMRMVDAHCVDYNGRNSCLDCAKQPIPADIAKKLGIKPISIKPQESIVDEYEHTKNRAYNLNHYLNWLNDVVPEAFEKALRDLAECRGIRENELLQLQTLLGVQTVARV